MIMWLLRQLEQSPRRTFTEAELTAEDAEGLEQLRKLGVLRIERRLAGPLMRVVAGEMLTLTERDDGAFDGFDPDDPDEPPTVVEPTEVDVWRPSVVRLAQLLADVHGLTGEPQKFSPHLIYCGQAHSGISVTLGLCPSESLAVSALASLPTCLAPHHLGHIAVLPSLSLSTKVQEALRQIRVIPTWVASNDLGTDPPIVGLVRHFTASQVGRLTMSRIPSRQADDTRGVEAARLGIDFLPYADISAADEQEFARAGFKSRLPVVFTGERQRRASNVVAIGGTRLFLPQAEFTLLLRLAVETTRSAYGWCLKGGGRGHGGLSMEAGVAPQGIDQAIFRLRNALEPALGVLDPTDFIEGNGRGSVRLSTHRCYLRVNRSELGKHPRDAIRRLALELPFDA
jgi:hypothetical protein